MGISLDEVRALTFAGDAVDASGSTLGANDGVDIGDVTVNNASGASAVNIQDGGNSLTVDFTRLLDSTDSVALGDGAGLFLDILTEDAVAAGGEEGIMILGVRQDVAGSPVTTDGDYQGLLFDGTGNLRTAAAISSDTADDAADADNPIKVGGKAQDEGSVLTALSTAGDRFDLTGDLHRRLHINEAYNVNWDVTVATVGATESQIATTAMTGRKNVIVQNVSANRDLYVRNVTGVTISNGLCIPAKSSLDFNLGESQTIFAIADGAGADIRISEAG